MTRKFLILLSLIFFSVAFALAEESITFTTYYPSPYGSYNNLTTANLTASNNVTLATQSGGAVVIGSTVAPAEKLEVRGNIRLGVPVGTVNEPKIAYYTTTNWYYNLAAEGNNWKIYDWDNTDFLKLFYGSGGATKYASVLGALNVINNGNVGIGTASPNVNALLDVSSTAKAFMPPRMTTAQKNAIPSPTAGMIVYDTTLQKLCVYTTRWEQITSTFP